MRSNRNIHRPSIRVKKGISKRRVCGTITGLKKACYHFSMKVVLAEMQPKIVCVTKNVVFMWLSGFVVLTQSYHLPPCLQQYRQTGRLYTECMMR